MRKEITSLQQGEYESFPDYYDRYKSLLVRCPHHGMSPDSLLMCFYEGLTPMERTMLDASAGGSFMNKTVTEGEALLRETERILYDSMGEQLIRLK